MESTLRTARRGVLLVLVVVAPGLSCTNIQRKSGDGSAGGVAASPTASQTDKRPVAKTAAPVRRTAGRELAGRTFNEPKNSPLERTSTPRGQPEVQVAESETTSASGGQSAPASIEPRPRQSVESHPRHSGSWGWLGLLGLLGLAGLRGRRDRGTPERLDTPVGALADRRVRVYEVEAQASLKAPR
jgi:MYXO-CTERM domain-containing protein